MFVRTAAIVVAASLLGVLDATGRVEAIHAAWLGPALVGAVAAVSGSVPFGLAEPVLAAGVLWMAWPLAAGARRATRAPSPPEALTRLATAAGAAALRAAVAALWFYAAWGLGYGRPSLVARQGWDAQAERSAPAEADLAELRALAAAWVARANAAYLEVHGVPDALRPTALADAVPGDPNRAWTAVDAALDEGFRVAARELREPPAFARSRGIAKPVRLSGVMSRMQLAGFFFPWTGEANVNRAMPPFQLPHTMAHEKAHQRGIATEDEANFVGFLAAIRSPSALARYSGHLFAQRQLLGELCARDAAACDALLARRHAGVQRDVDDARAFWARFEGPAAEAQEAFNDAYLQANGVADGVASYDRSVRLLVVWVRASGGLAAMGDGPAPLSEGAATDSG